MTIKNPVCLLLLELCMAIPLAAITPRTLPDVPLVVIPSSAGAAAQMSASLFPATGQGLLVIISPDSPESKVLLGLLNNPPDGVTLGPSVVIVVEDRDASTRAAALRDLYPRLAGVSWFADESRGLRTALELNETPIAIAVRDRKTQWSISGLTGDLMAQKNALLGIAAGQTVPPPPTPPRQASNASGH